MSYNPALFIRLPQGISQSDVERVIDGKDFGEIESVGIQKDRNGHRNAIVRFSRWFRSADRVLNSLKTKGAITIVAGELGDWKANVYVESSRDYSSSSGGKKYTKQSQRRPRSPVLTEESEIPEVILEFIETCRIGDKMPEPKYVEIEQQIFYAPLPADQYSTTIPVAPALPSYEQDQDAMEGLEYGADLEEGEIWGDYGVAPLSFERYRNSGYYY